jgi:hypothetical protein
MLREIGSLALSGTADDGWKVSAALLAKNVGGGINYIAGAYTKQHCYITFHKLLPSSVSSINTS